MTDQELIAQLRYRHEVFDLKSDLGWQPSSITKESADRIEELVKERDGYLAERNKFQLYLQRTHADWELEVAAVEALNAKLAKAVQALRKIANYTHIGEPGQGVKQHAEARIAKRVLAELESGK